MSNDNEYDRISIRVKKNKKAKYRKYAQKEDRSLSNWITHLADDHINELEGKSIKEVHNERK